MPLAEILVLCGFFMIYIVEEVTHAVLGRCQPDKKGGDGAAVKGHHDHEDMLQYAEQENTFEVLLISLLVPSELLV